MNSETIKQAVYDWAMAKNFTAPYGVLEGEYKTPKGVKYKSVTFGYARTLDVEVKIFNRNFMIVRTSRLGNSATFNDFNSMMEFLETL